MGRKVDVADLVGAVEIAHRFGLAGPRVVHQLRRRREDFPQPVLQLEQAMIWAWPDLERWAKSTGRRLPS